MVEPSVEFVGILIVALIGVASLPWRSLAIRESWLAVSSAQEWISHAALRAITPGAASRIPPLGDGAGMPRGRTGVARRTAIHPAFQGFDTDPTPVSATRRTSSTTGGRPLRERALRRTA